MGYIIAIDGPAGSGKGTIAKKLSEKLNFVHIDSGAIYRCVTLEVIRKKINLNNTEEIANLANVLNIEFKAHETVYINGEDVTKLIREQAVNELVSQVSKIRKLRENVEHIQKGMSANKNVIMEGRDIGTAVFPNANIKFYLDADINERANRRYKENIEKGINCTYDEVLETLKNRDYIDMNREVSPLKKAEDAITIDSTNLSIEEVVNKMEEAVKNNFTEWR